VWLNLIRRSLGLSTQPIGFERVPAIGQLQVSSPPLLKPFAAMNQRKPYRQQVKPFNFLSTCHVRPFGHPAGVDPTRFQLIAPYESDSKRWFTLPWVDRYSTKGYRITTTGSHGDRQTARVNTYGEVIEDYAVHPEVKSADARGRPCSKATIGLLQRRHVTIDGIKPIGKESNSLEDVQAGVVHDEANVYTEYPDPRRDVWRTKVWPAVRRACLVDLERLCGGQLRRRALIDIRAGRAVPHKAHQQLLASVVRKLGLL
jgi:hypothetical protein